MLLVTARFGTAKETAPFEFRDGDRVVFLGATFIEREGNYGCFETLITAQNPDKKLTFRNLGWSGDTVEGDARAYFGQPAEGYKNLIALLNELKPTVILVGYGNNEAFAGDAGLPEFEKRLTKLCEDLEKHTKRIAFFAPLPHEGEFAADYNAKLPAYSASLKTNADKRGYAWLGWRSLPEKLTYNGLHYDEPAYAILAQAGPWGTAAVDLDKPELRTLRKEIQAKNELFFHKWRPANQTYLFGFRKHEQGRNAKEMAEFDPLIAAAEANIAKQAKALAK
ncbi:MAG: hypothetical protein QM811_01095 [Pirellulales bacterium]